MLCSDGKLRAEAWIDRESADAEDPASGKQSTMAKWSKSRPGWALLNVAVRDRSTGRSTTRSQRTISPIIWQFCLTTRSMLDPCGLWPAPN